MKKLIKMALASLLGVLGVTLDARGDARSGDLKRIRNSQEVFHELMQTPDHAIPHELLESAKCIAIIPGEKKAAYIVGGHYGRGVALCRTTNGWSGPVFLKIIGGSFGLQIGGSSTDVVMVFRNREGLQKLLSDKFKIGADATAAAGPVGRDASAATRTQPVRCRSRMAGEHCPNAVRSSARLSGTSRRRFLPGEKCLISSTAVSAVQPANSGNR